MTIRRKVIPASRPTAALTAEVAARYHNGHRSRDSAIRQQRLDAASDTLSQLVVRANSPAAMFQFKSGIVVERRNQGATACRHAAG